MGYPSYVACSEDQYRTWSKPIPIPSSGGRSFAEEMPDGRVLVTYRNQLGNRGTRGWFGDVFASEGWQPGVIHYGDEVSIKYSLLYIANRSDALTQYWLMPPRVFGAISPSRPGCASMDLRGSRPRS